LAWILGYRLGLGAAGGWLGLCLEIVVASALLWWRLERRGWLAAAQKAHALATARSSEPRAAAEGDTSVVVTLALEPPGSAKRTA